MKVPELYAYIKKLNTALNKILHNIENKVQLSYDQEEIIKELYKISEILTNHIKDDKRTKIHRDERKIRSKQKSPNNKQKRNTNG